ncbi:MAG TPA: carboxypeptidase regulatory-like domain-containing protein, partial [Pyrinomonadaceae bacterium]|nr:carboxypeptidase regulatory-like domain-containing protein [Pyrinomonadaceae bacterium]
MRTLRLIVGLLVIALVASGRFMFAQVNDVIVAGMVKDQTGGVLPGAAITVTEVNTGIARSTVTGQYGRYEVVALGPGTYQVRADLTGFQKVITEEVKLAVGDHRTLDIVMPVGEMNQQVTVAADASTVEPTRSSLAGLVEDKAIQQLPLNGRNFAQLAVLQEGVVSFTSNRAGFFGGRNLKFSVYGSRFNQNTFLLDGTNVNDIYNNSPGSVAGVLLGVDAVAEFEVITHNFSAEYGRTVGGIVNAVSKSGTNEVHGSVFEFMRNDNLDARNFFDRFGKPEFKRNQFGFSVGGPLKKDKTFLFGNFETLRDRLNTTNVATVPDDNARQGILPSGNVGVAPKVVPYVSLYPRANGRNLGGGAAEYLFAFKTPVNDEFFTIRADHHFSDRHSTFVRYNFDNANANRLPSIAPLPVFDEIEKSRNQYATIGHKILTSSL